MVIFIWGNLTADNFTPRPGKDTVGRPGQCPGLSAFESVPSGKKGQGIDVDRVKPPLRAIADDPAEGGTPGHFSIAPVHENGDIDLDALNEWASARGTNQMHVLTQKLLDAVVQPNVKG